MSIYINQIMSDDSELVNRLIASGPGGGVNRMMVVVEDAASISAYGVREGAQDFPDAVDYSDLTTKANEYLATVKDPVQEVSFTYYFSAEIAPENLTYNGQIVEYGGQPVTTFLGSQAEQLRRGDTVRVVSRSLGLAYTGVVDQLDWEPGSVEVRLGKPSYNLLDVINGPSRDEERKRNALGLPVPIGFYASTAAPGIIVKINPYTNSRAIGIELYGSDTLTTGDFDADQSTLLVKGGGTRFEFPNIAPGTTYYFKARSYDSNGDFSEFTEVESATSGYFDGGTIEEGTITDLTPFASALRPPRNVVALPTLPDPDYADGDLVVYDDGSGARIYENQTGTWAQLTASQLEGRTVAHQVVAGQVVAGAISADEIAADAVTAVKIDADAVTAGKIDADAITTREIQAGHVIIDDGPDSDNIPDRIRVNTTSGGGGADRAIMGYIAGKSGVPTGVNWGFWAEFGSGLFVPGALKVTSIDGTTVTAGGTWPGGDSGDVETLSIYAPLSPTSTYNLQEGEKVYNLTIVNAMDTGDDNIVVKSINIANGGVDIAGPGGSHFINFRHAISLTGRYVFPVTAGTSSPSVSFVNIQLRSFE